VAIGLAVLVATSLVIAEVSVTKILKCSTYNIVFDNGFNSSFTTPTFVECIFCLCIYSLVIVHSYAVDYSCDQWKSGSTDLKIYCLS
jgi:hypothetical protein